MSPSLRFQQEALIQQLQEQHFQQYMQQVYQQQLLHQQQQYQQLQAMAENNTNPSPTKSQAENGNPTPALTLPNNIQNLPPGGDSGETVDGEDEDTEQSKYKCIGH